MPGKEGPFTKKPAEDEGDYLQRYGTEPCIEVGLVREFQVWHVSFGSRFCTGWVRILRYEVNKCALSEQGCMGAEASGPRSG